MSLLMCFQLNSERLQKHRTNLRISMIHKCKFTKKVKTITMQQQYSHITVCIYIATYKIGHVYICIHYTQIGGYAIKVKSE